MKKKLLVLILIAVMIAGCNGGGDEAVALPDFVPTNTPVPPTDVPPPPPPPADTPVPEPTDPPPPTEPPPMVTVVQLDRLLRDNGYKRDTFKGIGNYTDLRPGELGFVYTGDNWMEPIKVYEDGYVRIEVFNDLDSRGERMERKLKMLDEIFPEDFMAELREAHEAYIATAGRSVSGTANEIWPPPAKDFWSSLEGQYNVESKTIGGYEVTFALWFWQIKCPDGYICWFPSFGDQVFLGESSFVFYNIEIQLAPGDL